MIAILAFLFSSTLFAASSYQTDVASGATETIDKFCECRRVTNANASTLMVPWKTSTAWASFYNNPTGDTSVGICLGGISAAPNTGVADEDDMGTACFAQTTPIEVTNRDNQSSYTMYVQIPAGFPAVCSASFIKTSGGTNTTTVLPIGSTAVSLCEGDTYKFRFTCSTDGNRGPYTIKLIASDTVTELDSFDVQFFFQGGFCSF